MIKSDQDAMADLPGHLSNLSEEMKSLYTLLYFGDWATLARRIENAPPSELSDPNINLFKGALLLQRGELFEAKQILQSSISSGCDKDLAKRILISGMYNSLARIELLRGNIENADNHLNETLITVAPSPALPSAIRARKYAMLLELGLLPQAVEMLEDSHQDLLKAEKRPSTQRQEATILASEIELLRHQLTLAQQKHQLFKFEDSPDTETGGLEHLSLSQLGQDLWVLENTHHKKNGYFVEFGATDGILLSNTFMLEKHFGWRGICAEPNPDFFAKLQRNRSCICSDACVSGESGVRVDFVLAEEYGGIESEMHRDKHSHIRDAYKATGKSIELRTVSLNSLLEKYNAPRQIDYLSIDTEGSEYTILSAFDFSRWDVKLITVEHNFSADREKIYELLSQHGYVREERNWDDWYIKIDRSSTASLEA